MSRPARAVMVCGTTSGAGKSLLATALARWYARQGLKVAPFKAQNMSNNARVVDGGEMGSAQYFQALAARCTPDVRMNPVLLKPEKDTHSQVILLGQRRDDLSALEWHARATQLWPVVQRCLEELRATHDVVVIEGAGSPAEINLAATDIVNMRVAEAAGAATLIVSDIDRGGAFAHLYGTYQLLEPRHRALVRGFVLNKFRGDASLLEPGPRMLEQLTGVPTLAVLPMWREHGLPEEDGVFDPGAAAIRGVPAGATQAHGGASPTSGGSPTGGAGLAAAIVAYPYISNLDEFTPLRRVPGLTLRWARDSAALAAADLLILPGSKSVAADAAWIRSRGMDAAIAAHIAAGKPALAICGGLQILGAEIRDPLGLEGGGPGLGLLPYSTELQGQKRYRRKRQSLAGTRGFWAALDGIEFDAYEIRHGDTIAHGAESGPRPPPADGGGDAPLRSVLPDRCGWQQGGTLAIYTHGLFESSAVMHALFGVRVPTLDDTLEGLADYVGRHFAEGTLAALLQPD
ncbi:MAG TPA: cobyric acid synthase [Steroidobacteraceae bacterium]|nr:cobyric acid synthase [Steroidobacteraceae bacterium]